MPTAFKVEDVEASLVATLQADAGVIGVKAQVMALSSSHFDEQGNLLVTPPAVLPLYEVTTDDGSRDNSRLTYQSAHEFCLLCGAQDLSSAANERTSCQKLLSIVRQALAGKRLSLDGGAAHSFPVELTGAELFQFDTNGIWYKVKIRVGAVAQFG